jgi:hypothetical protein
MFDQQSSPSMIPVVRRLKRRIAQIDRSILESGFKNNVNLVPVGLACAQVVGELSQIAYSNLRAYEAAKAKAAMLFAA